MQTFYYQGIDQQGRSVNGQLVAKDEASLEERMKAMGLWLVSAKAEKIRDKRTTALGKWTPGGDGGRRELIDFSTLMSFQLKVGIPMVQALDIAAADCANPRFRATVSELKRLVESGEPLADGMARFPKVFAGHFTSLIRAAETSGTVPEAFLELKRYLEWQEQIISDIRQATIYPAIVLGVVCLFVLVLFTFVVPKFVTLLTVAKVGLPLITRVVFSLSDIAKATWWLWILAIVVAPIVVQTCRKRSRKFDIKFDRVKFALPIFGQLNHMLVIARFAHNLAVLYRSGISIINSLKLCKDLVGSALVGESLVDVVQRVESGETISEALRRHPVFPQLLIRMVAMGERTGNLDTSLENVASYFNVIIPRRIKKVFSIMEPALILFLVAVVGTVALAIFLPIISLMGAVR
ncbi:MAG: type II secretion system F family protein [Nitrospira sp.]|nr:type II secretion system F family protein [Nitrospira sp.]